MNTILLDGLIIAAYFLGIAAALHALFKKGDPRSALIWVCVCLFIPFFGAIIYLIFGVNRVKLLSQKWRSYGLYRFQFNRPPHADFDINVLTPVQQALTQVGDKLFNSKITSGCEITPLFDGTHAYPLMLEAIDNAKERIYLSTYIFGTTGISTKFITALGAAAKRGVDVKVLIDGVGSIYTWPSAKKKLQTLGVDAQLFLPVWFNITDLRYLNLRSHAKVLVVDGSIGFTGGMNIHQNNYALNNQEPPIHDLHFKVIGPIVSDLQDAFLRNWYFNTKQTPHEQLYYDDRSKGDMGVRAVSTGPYQEYPIAQYLLVAAINSAQTHIRIMTPYFIIGSSLSAALIEAALRSVNVELILPESNNLSFVKGATEALLPLLLKFGVKVYYRRGHFAHSKIFIVDELYVFLGSSNMDTRSFYLNFEFNLEVYSKALSMALIEYFNAIKQFSREITCDWLQKQNFVIKLRNSICKLFSPYL
jgi:cardiolipin synthase A/B